MRGRCNMDKNAVKIGARILSNKALNKLLPSNKNIDGNNGQIENMRSVVSVYRSGRQNKKDHRDRAFESHFNNVISVLGVRGSGKTSVLLTMKYRITEENSDKDLILPLIVPENMGSSTDVLGCILGLLGDVVDEMEKTIYTNRSEIYQDDIAFKNYYESCRKKQNNPLREKYNALLRQYRYTQKDYREILLKEYSGLHDYIQNARHILDSDQKLVGIFEIFLEELLKVKRRINNKKEPLLFIFFDDVDLSTGRCTEVLNVILRYLSQPNIVVFIAGDYQTFSEVLTINALRYDDLLNEQMQMSFLNENGQPGRSALDARKILTQDLLKKIMPPALRYTLPEMDEKGKALFSFSTEADDKTSDSDSQQSIAEGVSSQYFYMYELIVKIFIDPTYEKSKTKHKKFTSNFLYYNNELIYAYFKIFDKTQRGAMNAYYFLYSILNEKIETEQDRCLRLRQLVHILIHSSLVLNQYEEVINKIIDIRDAFDDTFIDYEYIDTIDEAKTEDKTTIFILAHFIENLIILEYKKQYRGRSRKVHGANMFCRILNTANKKIKLYPDITDIGMLLQLYTSISMEIPNSVINKIDQEKTYFLEKYFDILRNFMQNEVPKEFFRKIYNEDSAWVDQKISIIMRHGGGDLIVLKDNIKRVYSKAKKINMSTQTLEHIHIELTNLFEKMKNSDSVRESLNLDETLLKKYVEDKVINEKDISSNFYIEKLVEVYADSWLYVENCLKYLSSRYIFTYANQSDYQSLLEFYPKDSSLYRLLQSYSEACLQRGYLLESEYDEFKRSLRRRLPGNRIDIIRIIALLDKVKKEVSVPNEVFNMPFYNNIEDFCVEDVTLLTMLEIYQTSNERNNSLQENGGKSFYEKFTNLKGTLMSMDGKKFVGFAEYIKGKEIESKRLNLDV